MLRVATSSAAEAAYLILDYVAIADDLELPGLEAALSCILHADERPARDIVREARLRSLPDARILELLEDHAALSDSEHMVLEQEAAKRSLGMEW